MTIYPCRTVEYAIVWRTLSHEQGEDEEAASLRDHIEHMIETLWRRHLLSDVTVHHINVNG